MWGAFARSSVGNSIAEYGKVRVPLEGARSVGGTLVLGALLGLHRVMNNNLVGHWSILEHETFNLGVYLMDECLKDGEYSRVLGSPRSAVAKSHAA